MATFPALNPSSSRSFAPGEYPHTVYRGLAGSESRVRHSSAMIGSEVRLSFSALSESDMLSILSHYQGQLGGYFAFALPSIAFAGMVDATVFTLSRYQWRYQAAPVVRDLPCGGHNVDVQLVSVTPEAVAAPGAQLTVTATIGIVPTVTTSGLALTVTASIEYGAAEAAGLAETVTASLSAGSASSGVSVNGQPFVVYATISGGNVAGNATGLALTVNASITGGAATSASGLALTVPVSFAPGAADGGPFINYPNFSSTTGLSLVSTSGVTSNNLYLTDTSAQDVGNVWTNSTRVYNSSFGVRWTFECSGGAGADGFCLQWYTANNVNGDTGGSVGRVLNSNVLHAIVFKTYIFNGVGWFKNGTQQGSYEGSTLASPYWRQTVYYWADYDHAQSKMFIYYSTSSTKPNSPSHTFSSFSFGSTAYYMGFGAGTGSFTDNHILKSWIAQ